MKKNVIIFSFLALLLSFTQQGKANNEPAIIPYPQKMVINQGRFTINDKTTLLTSDQSKFKEEISYLQLMLRNITGRDISVSNAIADNQIEIKYNSQLQSNEAYKLNITSSKIIIEALDGHGVFNAIQTLKQLLPMKETSGTVALPNLSIEDSPAYSWRGMHLDVSRHFYTVEYVKKHIDRLAFYKFNKLHLHLTDDQGWRIEIKQYPKLTEEGAWRSLKNKHDSICISRSKENPNFEIDPRFIHEKDGQKIYGGFYTQEEMKDIIKYAQERHIEIIPEVDMPGHMMAAIKAYPFLVDGEAGWGELFSTPICPCKEDVYTFSKNVLNEIIDLFPSKYIHIGADEVDKKTWQQSELCKEFMAQHNIKNVNELQSYFVHEMQDFVESKGKKIIAWDEILQGGTNPNVTVMYWRGWVKDAPLKAVNTGSPVIMTPTNPLYFDYVNNNTSANNVYHMDVVPKDIPEDKRHLIMGAQANLWAEYIPTENQADFQMYPRMIALAERVWTDNTTRFDDFSQRLLKHYPKLDAMGVFYRLPDIENIAQENVFIDKVEFLAKSPLEGMKIHYTLDGEVPSASSPVMLVPIHISSPVTLKMALFSPSGARGEIYNLNFKQSDLKKAVLASNVQNGLKCDFYNKGYKNTKGIVGTPNETFVVNNIKAPKETKSFGLKFDGFIDVPETGIYSFFFTCDDGGVLYVDKEVIVDNDGLHPSTLKSGQAALEKGLHPFNLDFIEGGGGYTLKLQYSFNGGSPQDIPDSWFKHSSAVN
ncbi:MAG: family 20 glycosylhydrolase [Dysgonomonas sp.]|nr:family 20 glycosylhydrolase [Dysgonomonas sp.]